MGEDATLWAFDHFYHMDKANAAVHCAPVRFSAITFRLYDTLMASWGSSDITQEMAEVRSHVGDYELDGGR